MSETARILLIDDEPGSRDGLGLLLRREGYAVEAVESGEIAMSLLSERPSPEGDGFKRLAD